MVQELNYTVFSSSPGWIGILGSAKGLLSITLPQPSSQQARLLLGDGINHASCIPNLFEDLGERLSNYFEGRKVNFPDKLDLSRATPFQREIWRITRLVPYGEVRSYSWVAEQIAKPKAVRAVGQALARNPLPVIIPCHRILAINGKLGGFSGGIEMKQYLLSLETSGAI